MIPRSLFYLIGLNLRARVRRILRGFRGIKGIALLVVLLGFIAFVAVGQFAARSVHAPPSAAPAAPPRTGALVILIFTLMTALGGLNLRGLYFSPAEVDFLFPAPVRRAQLVAYRIAGQLAPIPISSLLMAIFVLSYSGSFLSAWVGMVMYSAFLTVLQSTVSLVASTVAERLIRIGRVAATVLGLAGVAAIAAIVAGHSIPTPDGLAKILESDAARILLAPFDIFAKVFTADGVGALAARGGAAAGIVGLLIGLVFLLDIDYRDAAVETSRRVHARLRSIRRGAPALPSLAKLRLRVPAPPRWGGIGPLAWRQAIEATRNAPAVLFLIVLFAVIVLPIVARGRETLFGILFGASLVLPQWVPFDFRGDAGRMEMIKTLPVPGFVMALGQVLIPSLVVTVVLVAGCGCAAAFGTGPARAIALAGIAFAPVVALFLLSFDNGLFLLYPSGTRMAPGDVVAFARQMIAALLKLLGLGATGGLAFGAALLARALAGGSLLAGAAAAWLVCAAAAAGGLAVCAWAFRRYDISREEVEE
ncbi:MAG: hypothetical protein JXP34_26340 [Planctomycetes bacterium]|nr:hypothetical protein [Planctomycetota bacterium]